jgi:hypothetical protein
MNLLNGFWLELSGQKRRRYLSFENKSTKLFNLYKDGAQAALFKGLVRTAM